MWAGFDSLSTGGYTHSSPLHVPPSYEEGIVRGTRKLCGRADNNGYRILLPLAVEVVVAVGGPEE